MYFREKGSTSLLFLDLEPLFGFSFERGLCLCWLWSRTGRNKINNRLLSFMLALSFPITKRYRQQHHCIKKNNPLDHLPRRFYPTTTKSKYETNTGTATNIWKKTILHHMQRTFVWSILSAFSQQQQQQRQIKDNYTKNNKYIEK